MSTIYSSKKTPANGCKRLTLLNTHNDDHNILYYKKYKLDKRKSMQQDIHSSMALRAGSLRGGTEQGRSQGPPPPSIEMLF